MESGLLLDIVVGESTAILQLLAGEYQALLIWWNSLLILDLALDVVDGIGRLDLESDRLARQGLDEDLHTSAKTKDKVESGLLLNVVIGKSTTVLELLSGKDQALLVWWNALLVLDLGLNVVDGVGRLNLEGDGLASHYDAC